MGVDSSLLRGKTAEQKKVIKYFVDSGCLAGLSRMKDDDYDALVAGKATGASLKARALGRTGLDEDQLREIPPVMFEGYQFGPDAYARKGSDGKWRSSKYQITWLFFSSTQVYIYSYTFNMDEDGKSEKSEEYFYKDITNFSSSSDTIECRPDANGKKVTVDMSRFALVVPGEKFYCSMRANADTERVIQAMKQKLREKKQ